jgi:hypothetical protein
MNIKLNIGLFLPIYHNKKNNDILNSLEKKISLKRLTNFDEMEKSNVKFVIYPLIRYHSAL